MSSVLLVEDTESTLAYYKEALLEARFDVDAVSNKIDALEKLQMRLYDIAFIDIMLAGSDSQDRGGLEVINRIKQQREETRIIVVSATDDIKVAIRAMDAKVFRFIEKTEMKSPRADIVAAAKDAEKGINHHLYGTYSSISAFLAAPELTPYWETSMQSVLHCELALFTETLNQILGRFAPFLRTKDALKAFNAIADKNAIYGCFWSKKLGHAIWVSIAGKNGELIEPDQGKSPSEIAHRAKGNISAKVWKISGYERNTFLDDVWTKP